MNGLLFICPMSGGGKFPGRPGENLDCEAPPELPRIINLVVAQLVFFFRMAFGNRPGFESQGHFKMQNALAWRRLPGLLIARAAAMLYAHHGLLMLHDGGTQVFTQVKTAIFAQRTGTVEMKHGLRCLKVCPIAKTVSPGDDTAVEIKKINLQGF